MKSIILLGATGTIGIETCKIVESRPQDLQLYAIVAKNNWQSLIAIAIKFMPRYVIIQNEKYLHFIKNALHNIDTKILAGEDAICEIVKHKVDVVVAGISGFAGLYSIYYAIEAGQKIALANKEAMICAGEMLTESARQYGATIIPVDSEQSAIWQVFEKDNSKAVDKLFLTATGGPFWNFPIEKMNKITVSDALNHPKWKMGNKITIDSATMLNKGFEIIEAFYLFDTPANKIDVVVHPQAIIHSMVGYDDGSILAQLSVPDMKIPLAYAIDYPRRCKNSISKKLDLSEYINLEFFPPNYDKFPCLKLAKDILNSERQDLMIVLNTASEIIVEQFLQEKIKFIEIYMWLEKMIIQFENQQSKKFYDLDTITDFDNEIRCKTKEEIYHI